jgi:hypothetical protein
VKINPFFHLTLALSSRRGNLLRLLPLSFRRRGRGLR